MSISYYRSIADETSICSGKAKFLGIYFPVYLINKWEDVPDEHIYTIGSLIRHQDVGN